MSILELKEHWFSIMFHLFILLIILLKKTKITIVPIITKNHLVKSSNAATLAKVGSFVHAFKVPSV